MISAFSHRLLLIEQALRNNGAMFAQLQLLELDSKPGTDTSSQTDDDEMELSRLREWVVRLRVQMARTERRIERLRATVERHEAQLYDIKSRIIWSSGGCAVVRPQTRWDAHTDGKSFAQRELAMDRGTVNVRWPHTPHQKLHASSRSTDATARGRSQSARDVVDYSGVTPQLSRSFTSLLSVKSSHNSSVRVSAHATSSYRPI